jgi:DNA-directed RNA polymerase sigma subunit (sigma70/sigma32)
LAIAQVSSLRINTLTRRELDTLRARYRLGRLTPRTLQDVREELGVTAYRVAQIETNELSKLRQALRVSPNRVPASSP